jgi:hypothetical protein
MHAQEAFVFPVKILIEDEDALTEQMAAMRAWLDHRRLEPAVFRYTFQASPARGMVFRVEFVTAAEAVEFAGAFGGQLTAADLPIGHLDVIHNPSEPEN